MQNEKPYRPSKTWLLLLIPIFILCAWRIAYPRMSTPPVIVDQSLETKSLTSHIAYFIDETGRAGIADVASHPGRFRRLPDRRGDPSFGYSRDAYWFMFRVLNTESRPVNWILEFEYPLIDSLELYIPDGDTYRVMKGGDRIAFDEREMPHRTFGFPLTEPQGERIYFLRIESSGALTAPLTAWSPKVFQQQMSTETLLFGLSYGILLAMAIYHLFIFFSVREKSYLYLTFFIITAGLFSMVNIGIAYQYLWPDAPNWGNKAHPFFLAVGNLAAPQFVRVFLNTRERFPRIDLLLLATMALAALFIPLSLIIEYYHMTRATAMLTAFTGILSIFAGVAALASGYREARYYLLACLVFFIGAMLSAVRAHGFLPETFITSWSNQIGMVAMALLFSFGVADKINVIRREREKAVGDLAESEEKYRSVVENAHDGIVIMIEERLFFANTTFLEMLGYAPRDRSSIRLNDLLPDTPLGKQLVSDRYRRRINGEDVPARYEAQLAKKDGTIIDCVISASRINIEGRLGVLAIISDITSLKEAEKTILKQYEEIQDQYAELEALNRELTRAQENQIKLNEKLSREKEQLSAILKSINDAVIATDSWGRVMLMNRSAEHLTGRQQKNALGLQFNEVLGLDPESLGPDMQPGGYGGTMGASDFSETFVMTDRSLTLKREDGAECIVEIDSASFSLSESEKGGRVFAVRDITEKLKLEQEIQKAGKIESLGLLAGGIAHDFNNLLTAIIGNISLIREMIDAHDEACINILDRIEHAATQSVNLTRQLLTFARGGEPMKKRASIQDFLYTNIAFLLSGSAIQPRFDIQDTLWPVEVDMNQIGQVIHNLVINAMQAMPGGGELFIAAANVENVPWLPLPEGRFVRVSITDQGAGIPPHQKERVFDPYFSTKPEGSGLGLSICYSIVKKHGGHIDVASVEGEGSTFHVYLPATEGTVVTQQKKAAAQKVRRGRILVMDDEAQIQEVATGLLSHLGFDVSCADNGKAALEAYRQAKEAGDPFSAVIMDLTIPGGTGGREMIRLLLEYDPEAIALVSSGYSGDMVMANYRDYGFSGVLSKPYTMDDLAQTLDDVLNTAI